MKLKAISLMGLILTSLLTSSGVFAQKIMKVVTNNSYVILDQENAKLFNLNFENAKSELKLQEEEGILANIDADGNIVNLEIYNKNEFSASKLDRDGVAH